MSSLKLDQKSKKKFPLFDPALCFALAPSLSPFPSPLLVQTFLFFLSLLVQTRSPTLSFSLLSFPSPNPFFALLSLLSFFLCSHKRTLALPQLPTLKVEFGFDWRGRRQKLSRRKEETPLAFNTKVLHHQSSRNAPSKAAKSKRCYGKA